MNSMIKIKYTEIELINNNKIIYNILIYLWIMFVKTNNTYMQYNTALNEIIKKYSATTKAVKSLEHN